MGLFSKKPEVKQEYQEGDIVAHGSDTYRVRRNYGETLQIVNNTTNVYPVVPTSSVEDTYYCGHCGGFVAISRGLHPHD